MTNEPKFKKGDKVRLKSGWAGTMTVLHVAEDGSVHIQWDTQIRKNEPTEFAPDELELLPREKSFWEKNLPHTPFS